LSRYSLEREAKLRSGVRIILAGTVVPVTWVAAALAFLASSGPWFARGLQEASFRHMVLRLLASLVTLAGGILIVGLVRQARWRWAACGAWAGAIVAIGGLFAIGSAGELLGGLVVLAVGAAVVGTFAWVLLKFDPPAT